MKLFKFTSGMYSGHGEFRVRPWGVEVCLIQGEDDLLIITSPLQNMTTSVVVVYSQISQPIETLSSRLPAHEGQLLATDLRRMITNLTGLTEFESYEFFELLDAYCENPEDDIEP